VAFSIVDRWIRPKRQRLIVQPYPMAGPEEALDRARDEAARNAIDLLRSGSDVAFVTEGDPLLYSTFIDLFERVRKALPGVSVEVVPAVSSVTACAAAALAPLARRSERIAVLSATDDLDDLEYVLEHFDSVVLLKVRSRFDALVDRLDALGLLSTAVLVEECGQTEQRVTRDLRSRQGQPLSYFSMVLLCRTRVTLQARARAGEMDQCKAL
jgi:precorrin-2/cobalt-factor-2 C20-methyltransferase